MTWADGLMLESLAQRFGDTDFSADLQRNDDYLHVGCSGAPWKAGAAKVIRTGHWATRQERSRKEKNDLMKNHEVQKKNQKPMTANQEASMPKERNQEPMTANQEASMPKGKKAERKSAGFTSWAPPSFRGLALPLFGLASFPRAP